MQVRKNQKIIDLYQKPKNQDTILIINSHDRKQNQISNYNASQNIPISTDPFELSRNFFIVQQFNGEYSFFSERSNTYITGSGDNSVYLKSQKYLFIIDQIRENQFLIKDKKNRYLKGILPSLQQYKQSQSRSFVWIFKKLIIQNNDPITEQNDSIFHPLTFSPETHLKNVTPLLSQTIESPNYQNQKIKSQPKQVNTLLTHKISTQLQQDQDYPKNNLQVKIVNSSFTRKLIQGSFYLDQPVTLTNVNHIGTQFILQSTIGFLKIKYAFRHKTTGYYLGGTSALGQSPTLKPHCLACQYFQIQTRSENVHSIKNQQNYYLGIENNLLIFKKYSQNARDLMWRIQSQKNKQSKQFPSKGQTITISSDILVKHQIQGQQIPNIPLCTTTQSNIGSTFIIQNHHQNKYAFKLKQTGDYIGGQTGLRTKPELRCAMSPSEIFRLDTRGSGFFCIINKDNFYLGIQNGYLIFKNHDGNSLDLLWKFEKAYGKNRSYEQQRNQSRKFIVHRH